MSRGHRTQVERRPASAFLERELAPCVVLTSWPSGDSVVLADAEGHGPPVRWR